MKRDPMTYVLRSYCLANEPAQYAVYLCNKNGDKAILTFESLSVIKAFTEALNGLGFTKQRR